MYKEVQWFPRHPDTFFTWGQEIRVFGVKPTAEVNKLENNYIDLSNNTTATLLATESRIQCMSVVAPSYSATERQLAIGLSNGKIILSNFLLSTDLKNDINPKQPRSCVCLAWHETETNLLAVGLERTRNDFSIVAYDTERGIPRDKSSLITVGWSEGVHSMCWDKTTKVLYAGTSAKTIKIIDTRQNPVNASCTNAKSVYGLTLHSAGNVLASYYENTVVFWDTRNMDKSVAQFDLQKNINQMNWSPVHSNTLSILLNEAPSVHLFDFPLMNLEKSNFHSVKRFFSPFQKKNVRYISWHHEDIERCLALSETGIIGDFQLPQRTAITFDTRNRIWGATGRDVVALQISSPPSSPTRLDDCNVDDISEVMQRRALNNYGLSSDIRLNGQLAANSELKIVWNILSRMDKTKNYLGIEKMMEASALNYGILESERSIGMNVQTADFTQGIMCYSSKHRLTAKQLSGWLFVNELFDTLDRNSPKESDNSFDTFLNKLCMKEEFTRAAMIAVFNLKIVGAINILDQAADVCPDESLRMASIGLAGFGSPQWQFQCSKTAGQLKDPYLRAVFSFLSPSDDQYSNVLNDSGIPLGDRVAFACIYLSDTKLSKFIEDMCKECTERGCLSGVLLIGINLPFIDLLQSYVDKTMDIQTASVICSRFYNQDILADDRVNFWFTSYADLLDSWGLWEQRANLDIVSKMNSVMKNDQSVYLLCNFCGRSISPSTVDDVRSRSPVATTNKICSCPHCRKPLPRCALCLMHMGTSAMGIAASKDIQRDYMGEIRQVKPFGKWFSWCQTCRHGGHSDHLTEWFKDHTECPVAQCTCKCFSLDVNCMQN